MKGWECNNEGCGAGDEPAPRAWPHLCPRCRRPTDPTFEEPWAHEAEGYKLRHDRQHSSEEWRRRFAAQQLHTWEYKDARLRGDAGAADLAWRNAVAAMKDTANGRWEVDYMLVAVATEFDDLDRTAELLLEWYPVIDTSEVATDSQLRAQARAFVSLCIGVLEREASLQRPWEPALMAAMHEMHDRHVDIPMHHHREGFQRVSELRARRSAAATIARTRESGTAPFDGLPPIHPVLREIGRSSPGRRPLDAGLRDENGELRPKPWHVVLLAGDALDAAQTHDDDRLLTELITTLENHGAYPTLTLLLRARQRVVRGDLAGALTDLDAALNTKGDIWLRWLRPTIYATRAVVAVRLDPAQLDASIELCRTGRRHGLRWWRRVTPADTSLARLLLWRAQRPTTMPAVRASHVKEAVRLARRRCRLWNLPKAEDVVVLNDALTALDELAGRPDRARRHRRWAWLVSRPVSATERAKFAQAWAQWAVATDVPEFAAEAYRHLVALTAADAAGRAGATARERVLAAAQEYAEDAGYWLARTGNYREAALALETGRAIGLTEALRRGAGAAERDVDYAELTAQTSDGAVVYIAAAKAGGYALIVAANHDPQYVDLPRLSRARVLDISADVLPGGATLRGASRDAGVVGQAEPTRAHGLQTLWTDGLADLLFLRARGRIVTFVPVGLLSLLPLHAASAPESPGDEYAHLRHAGAHSAIRYAPNVRSLGRCRSTAGALAPDELSLLAVDAPMAAGADLSTRLQHVATETREVTASWTGAASPPVHDCTWEQFRALADDHTVWHLACHASADPRSIMDSYLSFTDKNVSLADLRESLRPGRRRLAVLSACQTNVTSAALPNEMVGLPSALIELGFAGVIASAWKVDDLATTYLMTAFYRWWCHGGVEPAIALNRAQQWLRGATRDDLVAHLPGVEPGGDLTAEHPYADPDYWLPFAYTGV